MDIDELGVGQPYLIFDMNAFDSKHTSQFSKSEASFKLQ